MKPALSLATFRRLAAICTALLLSGCATLQGADAADSLRAAETSFAKSMADRNFDAFAAHVADDAVFINSGNPLRGKAAILAFWKRFYERPEAPFSWRPEVAEVAGNLGYTTGPVMSPDGKVFAHFASTWRRTASGRWEVVFDNGNPVCDCKK